MERWARQQNKAKTARKDAVLKAQLEQQEREAKEEAIRKQMEEEGLGTFTKPAAPVSMPVKEQKKVCKEPSSSFPDIWLFIDVFNDLLLFIILTGSKVVLGVRLFSVNCMSHKACIQWTDIPQCHC